MNWIIDGFKDPNPRQRFAFIADCMSIVGISAATIVGGLFTISQRMNVSNLVSALLIILCGLAILINLFLVAYVLAKKANRREDSDGVERSALAAVIWLIFSAVALVAAYFGFTVIESMPIVR